jgi:hypothetical protein
MEFTKEQIIISGAKFVSYPRLPEDPDLFKKEFVKEDLTVNNELVFKKRITGLFSYYKGSKEEFMPRINIDDKIKLFSGVIINRIIRKIDIAKHKHTFWVVLANSIINTE